MGFGGISIWQLLIVLAIVILLFGTKRLRSFGSDLGNAVKGFRKSMDTEEEEKPKPEIDHDDKVIDSTVEKKEASEEQSSAKPDK